MYFWIVGGVSLFVLAATVVLVVLVRAVQRCRALDGTSKSGIVPVGAAGGAEGDAQSDSKKREFFTTKNIACLSMLTAIAVVLYIFAPFSTPFMFPGFLEFKFSDIAALLAGFMMGPIGGVIVIILKVLIKLPFSTTSGIGELGDLIFSLSFVLTATIIYMVMKNKKGAILGLVAGGLFSLGVIVIVNRFLLIPLFSQMFFGGMEGLAGFLSALYPGITVDNFFLYYLFLAVLPFNILRLTISALVTFFLYKHLSRAMKRLFKEEK